MLQVAWCFASSYPINPSHEWLQLRVSRSFMNDDWSKWRTASRECINIVRTNPETCCTFAHQYGWSLHPTISMPNTPNLSVVLSCRANTSWWVFVPPPVECAETRLHGRACTEDLLHSWDDLLNTYRDQQLLGCFQFKNSELEKLVNLFSWLVEKHSAPHNQCSTCPMLSTLIICQPLASPCR